MKEKNQEKTGTWIVRDIPSDLMRRARMAALAEDQTVRAMLMSLVEAHLKELEKKGMMPKGKI